MFMGTKKAAFCIRIKSGKCIKCINIPVFNIHQSHILTFTITVVSSVGEFVFPWNLCNYTVFVLQW